jgi:Protein of unknown function (DUF3048) N-terminal domain/Protein of unknown function (DUF3048) C-terminal domain
MHWTRPKILGTIAGLIVAAGIAAGVAFLLAAGSPAPVRPKAVASPSPSLSPVQQQLLSPFTGEPVSALGPVLAVKIDNIVYARPQTGLTRADIVYVLPVEGGLSRFLAIFSSHFPPVIGPVRSARADDLQLLAQFGRPAFAFSGAQPQLQPVVEHARIVNLYAGVVGGYYRNYNRIAPYNLYARTRQLLAEARGASKAHNIGFTFGPPPASGGKRTRSLSVSYPAASFRFTWDGARGRWLVWMDGQRAATTEGPQLSAPTVVIQYTTVATSHYLEEGRRPPFAETVGSGSATVLRNGEAYAAHWSRRGPNAGTTFTTGDGKPMNFARGQVWIVLVGKGSRNWADMAG